MEGLRNAENEHETGEENQPDIKGENNAIEMTDNFDGKLHGVEPDGKCCFKSTFQLCYSELWQVSIVTYLQLDLSLFVLSNIHFRCSVC